MDKYAKLRDMATDLFDMRFKDDGIDNYFLDHFMSQYISIIMPKFDVWFDSIWDKQIDDESSYGDIDHSITKIHHIDDRKVLFIEDHCSCADHTEFIVIQEKSKDIYSRSKYHIRIVWDDESTDYKENAKYVTKPSLKWYKDRGYNLDYDEKLHNTPLGGSYGDCRDNGYIVSAEFFTLLDKNWKIEHQGLLSSYYMFQHVVRIITSAISEIEENNE